MRKKPPKVIWLCRDEAAFSGLCCCEPKRSDWPCAYEAKGRCDNCLGPVRYERSEK
jgi:hypothetical protein